MRCKSRPGGRRDGQAGRVTYCRRRPLASACNTTESVQFTALANQTAIVRDGLPAIISRKSRSIVLVRPAGRGTRTGGRPVFIVAATNPTRQPFDLHVSDITVSQLTSSGVSTPLPVIPYEQLASEERNREIAAALLVGVSAAANSYSAASAGYGSANGTVYTPNGASTFHASYYDPTAAAIAQSNAAEQNEAMIAGTIEAGQRNMATLENGVLKDNTIMPGEWIGGQVHVSAPVSKSGQPKTYTITITIAGEVHSIEVTQGQAKQ